MSGQRTMDSNHNKGGHRNQTGCMPEGPWPRCITSWEPQKAKAGGKWGRQRTYPALSSQLALFTCPLPSPLSSIHKLASTQTPAHKSQGPQGEEQAGLTPKRHR